MSLRLLHTSDWHLGRALHEASLLEDQAWALNQLLDFARAEAPDAVVIAGDVYDRAVPPPEAVRLLDEVLTRFADLGLPTVVIAGNHDSPERLSFGARLLAARGLFLRGGLAEAHQPIEVPGKGFLYALPFVEPDEARGLFEDETLRGHAAATERVLERIRADAATRALPTALVAHAFVLGAAATPESERPVVGTAGSVPRQSFEGFDYVALGHLHAPQALSDGIQYSGSLLKYSFAEATHDKGALLVEVERGRASARMLRLGARRDVARIRGTLQALLTRPDLERHRGDLLEATLEDDGYVVDAKRRLQVRFPYLVSVLRSGLTAPVSDASFRQRVASAGRDEGALFDAFLQSLTGTEATAAHRTLFQEALAAVDREERGA